MVGVGRVEGLRTLPAVGPATAGGNLKIGPSRRGPRGALCLSCPRIAVECQRLGSAVMLRRSAEAAAVAAGGRTGGGGAGASTAAEALARGRGAALWRVASHAMGWFEAKPLDGLKADPGMVWRRGPRSSSPSEPLQDGCMGSQTD